MASAESIGRCPTPPGAQAVDATEARSLANDARQVDLVRLRTLFDSHYVAIWRLLRRLGVEAAQVDDAAQEVFWVAARRLAEIQPDREYAFLYGVALRVASNDARNRRAARSLYDSEDLGLVADAGPSPEEHVEQMRTRELLDMVLGKMPIELRAVFVLFEFEGMEIRDIAALHEIPVGTATSRLRRARDEFSTIAKRIHAALRGRERGSR